MKQIQSTIVTRRARKAFRAIVFCTLLASAITCQIANARSGGHGYSANDQFLIPPPPPTPVLIQPPTPVAVPYSVAYSHYNPAAANKNLTPEKFLPEYLQQNGPSLLPGNNGSGRLDAVVAKQKGFGTPRKAPVTGCGGVQAAAPLLPETNDPWSGACSSWYTQHLNRSQAISYAYDRLNQPITNQSELAPTTQLPQHRNDFRHRKRVVTKK